ncbi:MAG: malonyl-ACP O-methyltransferase [Victivallaceae bacterium]|nr:malonyl-ACP O-methyltransferase [Victivallaceae bacterium]
MIDKMLVRRRFARSIGDYDREAFVQKKMAETLLELLADRPDFSPRRVLEIGCGTGIFTRLLLAEFTSISELEAIDLVPECAQYMNVDPRVRFRAGDAETLAFDGVFDLIVSSAALQWIEDFSRFSEKVAAALRPGGVFAFSSFGSENLGALRNATGRGLSGFEPEEMNLLLGKHFKMFRLTREEQTLAFATPLDALRHLKSTGVTASGGGEVWTKGRLAGLLERFSEKELVYDCIYYGGEKL